MSIEDRMREIESHMHYEGSYYQRLVEICQGDVRSAALLDAAHDGDAWWVDLRRRPFAGDEELKMLYREMVAAQTRLRQAILDRLWRRR